MSEPPRLRDDDTLAPELRNLVRGARRSRPMSEIERARHRRNVARIASGPIAASVWLWSSKLWATLVSVATLGLGVVLIAVPAIRSRRAGRASETARPVATSTAARSTPEPARAARTVAPREVPAVTVVATNATLASNAPTPDLRPTPGPAHVAPYAGVARAQTAVRPNAVAVRGALPLPLPSANRPASGARSTSTPSDSTAGATVTSTARASADSTPATSPPSAGSGSGSALAGMGGTAASPPQDTLALETQTMVRAHGMLGTQPGAALALVEDVLHSHPQTSLAPEGLYIAVHALRRLGREEDARVRARRLVATAPRSPQARAVRRLFPDLE